MATIDLRKVQRALYAPKDSVVALIEVPPMRFLAIDGTGDPNTSAAYAEAVSALYTAAYAVKGLRKRAGAEDYAVMPLEGFWSMADDVPYAPDDRDRWVWTLLIRQPDDLTTEEFAAAREGALRKKGLAKLAELRLEEYVEGLAAQTLRLGPYADEAPTLALLHRFIEEQGHTPRDKHHEIYLGDPRRTAPARLKTILRQPVR